jgi:hypothetical protein
MTVDRTNKIVCSIAIATSAMPDALGNKKPTTLCQLHLFSLGPSKFGPVLALYALLSLVVSKAFIWA